MRGLRRGQGLSRVEGSGFGKLVHSKQIKNSHDPAWDSNSFTQKFRAQGKLLQATSTLKGATLKPLVGIAGLAFRVLGLLGLVEFRMVAGPSKSLEQQSMWDCWCAHDALLAAGLIRFRA